MIRILHSVSYMDRAGVETMLMNYYRHIDRSEIQFDFLCNRKKRGAYDDEIKALGGRIYYSPGFNPLKYPKYIKFMKQFTGEHPEYKIIHSHNSSLAVYPLFAAKLSGVPVRIGHMHSASITKNIKWPMKVFCKQFINAVTTHKWACGKAAAEFYYGKRLVANGETKVINNAIEIDKFLFNKQIRERLRAQYDLEDKLVIGHAGRFAAQKNHTFLIDIFAELHKIRPDAVLILLGEGELQQTIREKVNKLGLTESVVFMGNVNNTNEWYQAFDVFVLPSIWEGLPVVGIEAQSADLPCVFSDDITREVAILPSTKYIKRSATPKVWADAILNAADKTERTDQRASIKAAGYDIYEESVKLTGLYKEILQDIGY